VAARRADSMMRKTPGEAISCANNVNHTGAFDRPSQSYYKQSPREQCAFAVQNCTVVR
jgi:hypothetical protein